MNRRRTTSSGFTLIELLLVLAILTLVVSSVAPSLRGFGIGRRNKDAAAQFVALARYARTQAISEAREYRINFENGRAFYLTLDDGGTFATPSSDFGKRYEIAEDVTMDIDVTATSEGQYVKILPSGMTDPAHLKFTNAFGEVLDVACRSATETFEVIPPVATP